MADILEDLLDPSYTATKSYSDLLREGVPHKGGLAMLAREEDAPSSPVTDEALQRR
jgi:hypothetical protein